MQANHQRRRKIALVVQARRCRATVAVDSGVVFALTILLIAILCGQATALAPGVLPAASKLRLATSSYLPSHQVNVVERAMAFADQAHEGQFRKSGEPYVVHPIETACILAEMQVPADAVVAGLLHDVAEDTEWSVEQLCERFGNTVGHVVAGVTDEEAEPGMSKAENDVRNQRRLMKAMSLDFNVVLVKLADRVHNMRTLDAMPEPKRRKKAQETLDLFVPLAEAVGITTLEDELRRLSANHLGAASVAVVEKSEGWWLKGAEAIGAEIMGWATPDSNQAASSSSFATAQCPALLHDFLDADEMLRNTGLEHRFSQHRRTWAKHCAEHTTTSTESLEGRAVFHRPSWLGGPARRLSKNNGAPSTASDPVDHLRALYASALVAGFVTIPSPSGAAVGADFRPALDSLAALLS